MLMLPIPHHVHVHITDNSGIADPFAPSILLPVVSVLDRLLEQFVLHSIRRYPLIFGPWRKRFDGEIATVSKLSLAVVDIIRRSPHTAFRKRSRRIIQALNSTDVDANVALEHLLQAVLGNTADEDPVQTKCVLAEPKGDFYNLDYADTLSRALERIYKAMPRSSRRRDLCSIFPDKGYRRTADKDDFALSDCPDLPRSDEVLENDQSSDIRLYPLAKPDLWLDEDAETLGGSQEGGDPITHDDASLVNDIDIWVSDEAESLAYAPLESSDDFWDSSQSTTLDVCPRCLSLRALLIHDYR
ncbi:hypothetical protein BD310DRAFT_96422 [Dichomitus squalens]|uniref:Uncharacterized protein n=1 Tax=Dichomitus squalens TaxID=114155 RepID=A0A4Q9Q4V9_9APHY|nr:hypothetical protein BD310DRAFT_96422 [Dichomitus squalens]